MMKATVTFADLNVYQMADIIRASKRLGLTQPNVHIDKVRSDVWIESYDDKIQAIKAVRTLTGCGLKEGKDLVEMAPAVIKVDASPEDAKRFRETLEAAGCRVSIR